MGERAARRFGVARSGTTPVEEIVGQVGQRAHPPGGHVEQVFGPVGGVGHAFGQPWPGFEQDDPQWHRGLAQALDRRQYAGRAPADDRNVEPVRHARALPT